MAIARAHRFVAAIPAALCLAICFMMVAPAGAATLTWNGTSGAAWNTTSINWNGAATATPWDSNNGPSDSAWFSTSAASANATGNSLYVNGITFAASATNSVITGGTLNVSGSNITMNSSKGTAAIGSIMVFGSSGSTILTCTNSKTTLLFSGALSDSGNLTTSGSGNFVFSGGSVNIGGTLQEGNNDPSRTGVINILPGTTVTCGTYAVGFFSTLTVGGTMNTNSFNAGNSNAGMQFLNGIGVINTPLFLGANNGRVAFSNGVLNISGTALIGRTDAQGGGRNFQQDSGTVNITGTGDGFMVGFNATSGTSAYLIDGGVVNVPNEYVELCYSATTGTAITGFQVLGSAGTAATANVYGISLGQTLNNGVQNGNGLLQMGNAGSLLVIGSGGIIAASSGNLQVQLGSGTLASSAPWSTTMPITLNGSAATNINPSGGTINLGGIISGTKGLQEIGSGVLLLTALNTYSGVTTVAGGTLQLGDGTANVGSVAGNISTASGTVVLFDVPSPTSQTFSSAISGSGSLVVAGPGVLALNGTSSYTGGTTVSAGTLQVGDGVINNGIVPGGVTNNAALVFANPSPQTFAGTIGGNGGLFVNGPAPLTLSGSNTYSGGTTLAANTTVYINSNTALGSGTLTITGGTIDSTAAGVSLGNVSQNWNADFTFGGTNNLNVGSGPVLLGSNRTVTLNSGVLTVNGPISDGGMGFSLNTAGTGTLALGGTSTYSGGTNVNSGALVVNGALTGSGGVTVQSGGTLAGTGLVSGGGVTLSGGATLAPGPSPLPGSIGAFTASSLAPGSGATIAFDLSTSAAGAGNDLVNVTGSLSLPNGVTISVNPTGGSLAQNAPYTLFNYGSLSYAGSPLVYSGPLGARQAPNFSFGTGSNSSITLTIVGYFANLIWTGTGSFPDTWDQNDTSNLSWTSVQHPTGDYFAALDNVTFDATSSPGNQTVFLSGALTPSTVTVTGTKNYTFASSGQIGGATALTVVGPGSLTIQNFGNNYTGGTNLQGGSIVLGVANGLPTSGTVTFGASSTSGTLDLAGNNQVVGGLAISSAATASQQVITDSTGSATLSYAATGSSTFAGTITDAAPTGVLGLEVSGGQLVLSGNSNNYTGGTTVNGGTLQLGVSNSLPTGGNITALPGGTLDLGGNSQTTSGAVSLQGGTLQNGTITSTAAAFDGQSGIVTASLAGPVALNKSNGGTLVVSNSNNSYSGGTNISGGILQLGAANALPAGGNITVFLGGTFDLGGLSQSTSGVASFQGGTVQNGTLAGASAAFDGQSGTVTANLTGSVGLNKTTSGMLTLGGSDTYTGNTVVSAGVLQLGSSAGVPGGASAGTIILNGGASSAGTVDVNGLAGDFGGLSGTPGAVPGTIVNNAFGANTTLAVGDNNTSTTFSGTIIDGNSTLALQKAGSGMLTLAGTNAYSGGTTVAQGILALANTAALGTVTASTGLSVKTGGELQLPPGVVTSVGTLLVAGSGVTGPGAINGGTLNVLGTSITMNSSTGTAVIGSPTVFSSSGSTVLTATKSTSTLLFSGPVTSSGGFTTSGSGNFVFSGGSVNISGTIQEGNSNSSRTAVLSFLPGTTVTCGTYTSGFFSTLTVGGTMNTNLFIAGNSNAGIEFLNGQGVINTPVFQGTNNGMAEFSNGVLNVSGTFMVGRTDAQGGARNFQQDSGTVNITGTGDGFTIGLNATSVTGAYTLDGGTLNAPNEYVELCYSTGTATTGFLVTGSAGTAATANVYGISLGQTVNNGVQNGNGLVKLGNNGSLLVIGAGGIIAASSGSLQVQLGSGTLASSAPWSTTMPITLNGSAATNINPSGGEINLGGTISGTKGLQEIGSGVLLLTASNTYSGATAVAGGTLQLGDGTANVGSLAGNISTASGAVVLFDVPNAMSETFSSAITGSGSLVLDGPGSLTLSGTGTFTGGTTDEDGALILANSGALASGSGLTVGNPSIVAALIVPPAISGPPAVAVPEPGTLALLALAAGCGIGIWGLLLRKKLVSGRTKIRTWDLVLIRDAL